MKASEVPQHYKTFVAFAADNQSPYLKIHGKEYKSRFYKTYEDIIPIISYIDVISAWAGVSRDGKLDVDYSLWFNRLPHPWLQPDVDYSA